MTKKPTLEKNPHQNKHTTSQNKHRIHNSRNAKPRNNKKTSDFFEEYGNHVALGAVALGLGIGTFVLLNSRNRKKSYGEQFCNTYEDYKENAEDMANNVYEKGKEIYDYATDYADNIKDKFKSHPHWSLFLLGAAGGITIGGTVAYLIGHPTHDNKNFLEKLIGVVDQLKESACEVSDNINSNEWLQTAKDVLETISEKVCLEKNSSKSHSSFNFQNAIDLGLTGFKVWEKLSKRN